jgi:TatA/E family protein of Tat protein translocase
MAVRETSMFAGIGPAELILIFIIALLVFGPKKLPEIGRTVGKAMREFKKASEDIKSRIEEEIEASEIKDIRKDIQSGADAFKAEIEAAAKDAAEDPAKDTKVTKEPEHHEIGEGPKVS